MADRQVPLLLLQVMVEADQEALSERIEQPVASLLRLYDSGAAFLIRTPCRAIKEFVEFVSHLMSSVVHSGRFVCSVSL
jgi:hypothetical protein